jgi:hypothetical protein
MMAPDYNGLDQLHKGQVVGTYLPHDEACVGVLERWQSAIRSHRKIGVCLDFIELEVVNCIRQVERFENHCDFPGIGCAPMAPQLERFERHLDSKV